MNARCRARLSIKAPPNDVHSDEEVMCNAARSLNGLIVHSRSEDSKEECRCIPLPNFTQGVPSLGTPLVNMRLRIWLLVVIIVVELVMIYGALRIMAGLDLVPRRWFYGEKA